MNFIRATVVVAVLFYIFLWVLVFNGVSSLIAPLAVPLILALLVGLGVRLNHFLGITPRRQSFQEPEDDPDQ